MFNFFKRENTLNELDLSNEPPRVTFIIELYILPSRNTNEVRALIDTLKDIALDFGENIQFKYDKQGNTYKGYITCADSEAVDALGDFLDIENSIQRYQITFLYRMKGK